MGKMGKRKAFEPPTGLSPESSPQHASDEDELTILEQQLAAKAQGDASMLAPACDDSDDIDLDPREIELVRAMQRQRAQTERKQQRQEARQLMNQQQSQQDDDAVSDSEDMSDDADQQHSSNQSHESQQQRVGINNIPMLRSRLAAIALPPTYPWIETLQIATQQSLTDSVADVHDDLARESAFYTAAHAGVRQAVAQLQQQQVPYVRPADFYAEMIKPDAQMHRIKQSLLTEQQRLSGIAQRRKHQETQKYSKQVQVQREVEKVRTKKQSIAEVAAQRRKHKQTGALYDDKGDGKAEQEHSTLHALNAQLNKTQQERSDRQNAKSLGTSSSTAASTGSKSSTSNKSSSRKHKDEKYGFGGKKRFGKSNDAESTTQRGAFNSAKNREMPKGFSRDRPGMSRKQRATQFKSTGGGKPAFGGGSADKRGGGGGSASFKGGAKRPGKAARQSK